MVPAERVGCASGAQPHARDGPEDTPLLPDLHRVLALLVATSGVALSVVVLIGALTRRPMRFARDRIILLAVALVAVGAVTGLVMLAAGDRPDDGLHLLYGAVAVLVLPLVRLWGPLSRRRALAVGAGGIVLALLVLRLFQTG